MKPPSYLLSQDFTFDTKMFGNTDCLSRKCTIFSPQLTCYKCICLTTSYDDKHYKKFSAILIKEIS